MRPSRVVKRDGQMVPFEVARITSAISQAQRAVGNEDQALAAELARVVLEHLERISDQHSLGIEEIQDAVVHVLQESGNYDVAIAYLRYRDARERFRRSRRVSGEEMALPNLAVVDLEGRRRPWDRAWLQTMLCEQLGLAAKAATDVIVQVESFLADSPISELAAPLMLSLVDAALVRCGMHSTAEQHAPLRISRPYMREILSNAADGNIAVQACGHKALEQWSLTGCYSHEVIRQYCRGRLWIDGVDDPRRGSQLTISLEGSSNPWQVITQAFTLAGEAASTWRRCSIVLPPSILGHLERGAVGLVKPIVALSSLAFVHLYCDGRTPLLEQWPFVGRRVSIATYADDFLLLRRLQELRLPLLSGPHLMQGGYRSRVVVELALNAQGLENEYSQMDLLAMALVSAAKVRLSQMGDDPVLAGGDIRFAIYGLPANSASNEYLERQVVQEGLRNGLTLARTTNLPEEACAHLGRLLE
jgi:hypothetical protein